MPPTAIEFLNKESVQKFKTVKQITPVMIARGFVVNPGSKLKDLKKMLIEYDKQKHDDAAAEVDGDTAYPNTGPPLLYSVPNTVNVPDV
jgi:hypothetical protein